MPPVIGLTVQPGVDSSVLMTGICATMLPTLGVKSTVVVISPVAPVFLFT